MPSKGKKLSTKSSDAEVNAFLKKVDETRGTMQTSKRARLIFAMDATASREPTWTQARGIQSEMFSQTAALGGLEVQLCFYRGFLEFENTSWISQSDELLAKMHRVTCAGGATQIARVLEHTILERNKGEVATLIFVGDCMEENPDRLCQLAGTMGLLGVPAFVFQEGYDPLAEKTFREIARLSKGAFNRFDANSPRLLRELLGAAAVYAAGGKRALERYLTRNRAMVKGLLSQMNSGS